MGKKHGQFPSSVCSVLILLINREFPFQEKNFVRDLVVLLIWRMPVYFDRHSRERRSDSPKVTGLVKNAASRSLIPYQSTIHYAM